MRISWSEAARADLDAIHEYISRDSVLYAERYVQGLIAAVDPLAEFPQLGRIVPEGDGRHRELVFAAYRILYRTDEEQVLIVAVIHGARDVDALWERGDIG